ncbi:MAG: NHLP leader peptide family RiPP precursor [Gaiellales bacterium]
MRAGLPLRSTYQAIQKEKTVNDEQSGRALADLYARALTDADFKAELMADAASVLREAGVEVPEGMSIKVVENSPSAYYLVLPDPEAMSDELLSAASGGSSASTASTAGTAGTFLTTIGSAGSLGSAGSAG